jgi:hypothetical protein
MRKDPSMARIRLLPLLAAAALAAGARPAAAQTGNQSDIPITPISAAGGGSYLGPGLRTDNEMFTRTSGGNTFFRSAAMGCVLRTAEQVWRDSVAAAPRTPSERRVQILLGALPGPSQVDSVALALAHGADPASTTGRASRALAESLDGLLRDRCGCLERREDYVEAKPWQDAIRAFNDYVRIAPESAFAPPAPELVAIHAALQRVIFAALHRTRA